MAIGTAAGYLEEGGASRWKVTDAIWSEARTHGSMNAHIGVKVTTVVLGLGARPVIPSVLIGISVMWIRTARCVMWKSL